MLTWLPDTGCRCCSSRGLRPSRPGSRSVTRSAPTLGRGNSTAVLADVTDSVAEAERVVYERLAPVFASGFGEYVLLEEYGGSRPTPDEMAAGFLADQPIGPPEMCRAAHRAHP